MAFEGLSEKLQGAFGKLKSKGTLSEKDIDVAMREVKLALLEAWQSMIQIEKQVHRSWLNR